FCFSDLRFLEPETLRVWLVEKKAPFMIIDVREDDYSIGKIKGSFNMPYYTLNQTMLDSIYERSINENIQNIVFHCSYSQQRGPSTALAFLRSLD
ncbi:phosphatase YCH1 ASCRUDRAFT_19880, partial [Ascoidea rubescens DSM 1968]